MRDEAALRQVAQLRQAYADQCAALPWLDACAWPDDPPAFPAYARTPAPAGVPIVELRPDLPDAISRVLVRAPGSVERQGRLLTHPSRTGVPVCLLHTDVPVQEVARLAESYPSLALIVESGPQKLLYHIAECESLLRSHANTYLCTYNLCNWQGLERLCAAGVGERLLFGTHAPRYSPHAAMGPVVFSELSWREKCGIAGDNLRRLLGMAPLSPAEVALPEIEPFVVDAHTHSGPNERFPVPDGGFAPADWLAAMDRLGIDRIVLCPYAALTDPSASSAELSRELRAAARGRVRYLEVFDPRRPGSLSRVEAALRDPGCAGIKMHPSFHETAADDELYAPLFALAARAGAPILTHSWDISPTNPVQHLSHPARFRRHLLNHPEVTLILGHAGGRPGAMESVVALCSEFASVYVDLAGDYYDDGLTELLADRVGARRVIFGSDLNWIDPRANLAPVLASDLSDEEAYDILRGNALRVYWRE